MTGAEMRRKNAALDAKRDTTFTVYGENLEASLRLLSWNKQCRLQDSSGSSETGVRNELRKRQFVTCTSTRR